MNQAGSVCVPDGPGAITLPERGWALAEGRELLGRLSRVSSSGLELASVSCMCQQCEGLEHAVGRGSLYT